jgi:hypothetical protein
MKDLSILIIYFVMLISAAIASYKDLISLGDFFIIVLLLMIWKKLESRS